MKAIVAVASATILFALQCLAVDILTPERLAADIKTEGLQRNLLDLNQIANQNGGNRAFGLPGYKASSDYVLGKAKTNLSSEFDTWVQYFNHTFEQTRQISVTGPDGENVAAITLLYNSATPLPDGITAALIDTPIDDTRGSGCFQDQWTGINATGKLALVKRGVCSISDKLKLAKAHGALGVILWNQVEGTPSSATLSAENIGLLVPVAVVTKDVGEAWKARLAAGNVLKVKLLVDSIFEQRQSWNVFAETKEGDPANVVMLGAHLDSVQAGPGINDDGSGTTALLEIMTALRQYKGIVNKVRLAWWGAEESGLVGSLYYTSNLNETEADRIRFYFNYDMIGSPFPTYTIYQGNNTGDAAGAVPLLNYLTAAGKPAKIGAFGSSSDYVGFLKLGIPSSGLHTGAGAPTDPCYHLVCDTTSNINAEALTANAKAAAFLAAKFALSLEGVPPRSKTTLNPRNRAQIRSQLVKWQAVAKEGASGHTCAHKSKNTV